MLNSRTSVLGQPSTCPRIGLQNEPKRSEKWAKIGTTNWTPYLLDGYAQVYCHLDNDDAGENACAELQKRYGDKVIDHSHLYTGYKDLNEYLMSRKTRK